jgi:hypothetical protein
MKDLTPKQIISILQTVSRNPDPAYGLCHNFNLLSDGLHIKWALSTHGIKSDSWPDALSCCVYWVVDYDRYEYDKAHQTHWVGIGGVKRRSFIEWAIGELEQVDD